MLSTAILAWYSRAHPMKGLEITIPAGDGAPSLPAFAILPEGATRGAVVIHEIFGRRPEIDRVVERLAAAGYAAVAPDLFHGGRFACLRDVFLAMKTGDGVCVRQGRNARAWLCKEAGIEPSRVGLIGFCFGGGYALLAGAGWGAVSANYGTVPSATAMRGIGPVIGCYGARDRAMKKAPDQLRARLAEVGQDDSEVHVFDAGHSFLTDGEPHWLGKRLPLGLGDYPDAREDGWRRILGFFERHLPA
jgi:carboxymethylenebutenolidase